MMATSFAFVTRAYLISSPTLWPELFNLDKVQAQELFMAGIWPFAIAIISCGLITDKIGYRRTMFISAGCYATYIVAAVIAQAIIMAKPDQASARSIAYDLLYWGSVALGFGSGAVEGFINPVIATIFRREKTKWLNRLHAGWPAGLAFGGLCTIAITPLAQRNWLVLVVLLALPVTAYIWALKDLRFPVNERVEHGTSYRRMLAEFGVLGCALAAFLLVKQLSLVPAVALSGLLACLLWVAIVVTYWQFSRSWGRPLLLMMCLMMIPLAISEVGTDSAITGIMEARMKVSGWHPLWVLIFSAIVMFTMRASAGMLVKRYSPIQILCACAGCAALGLLALSDADTILGIFLAAGFYGAAKAFLWPTMLGVAAEQCPKGGALTLTALSGIGMLAAGILGGPLIGAMQESVSRNTIERRLPGIYPTISRQDRYVFGHYAAIDPDKVRALDPVKQDDITKVTRRAKQKSVRYIALFPATLLGAYLGMFYYFKQRGGYRPKDLGGRSIAREVELGL